MRKKLLKFILIFTLLMSSITLFSCQKKYSYENPYFTDFEPSEKNDFEFLLNTYFSIFEDYYIANYNNNIGLLRLDNRLSPEYNELDEKNHYTREETEKYDAFLNQIQITMYPRMGIFTGYKWYYPWIDMSIDSCTENTDCHTNNDETIYYSVYEDKLYFYYSHEKTSLFNTINLFMEKSDDDKLHMVVHLTHSNMKAYTYIEFQEDEKAISIFHDDDRTQFDLHDIHTGEYIQWNKGLYGTYSIDYYDPIREVEISLGYQDEEIDFYAIHLYEKGHRKLSHSTNGGYTIGLNDVSGWDNIQRGDPNNSYPKRFLLYQGNECVHDELFVDISLDSGDINFFIYGPNFEEDELDDLISLNYFGLESGFTKKSIDDLVDEMKGQVMLFREKYDLVKTQNQMYDWFVEKTGNSAFNNRDN